MAKKRYTTDKKKVEDSFIQSFTEKMIKKLEEIQSDWQKPWVTNNAGVPRNFDGRHYAGINQFILSMEQEDKGYPLSVWITYHKAKELGVNVKKGETSTAVWLSSKIIFNEEGNKITNKQYNELSKEEQDKCVIKPFATCFNVFNIAQTTYPEAKPEEYAKLNESITGNKKFDGEDRLVCEELDALIDKQKWVCKIEAKQSDSAYYSISKDAITIPLKSQFPDAELYYSTMLHEMAHSTGSKDRLNRLQESTFGSTEYAQEELVAEMTAAIVSNTMGISKTIKEDSVAYLKSWLDNLKQNPDFIKKVVKDVNKAAKFIEENVYSQNIKIDNVLDEKQAQPTEKEEQVLNTDAPRKLTDAEKKHIDRAERVLEIKEKRGNHMVLLNDKGSFYVYGDDADKLSKINGNNIKETIGKGTQQERLKFIKLNQKALDMLLAKLVRNGNKVIIADYYEQKQQKQSDINKVDTSNWKYVVSYIPWFRKDIKEMSNHFYEGYEKSARTCLHKLSDKVVSGDGNDAVLFLKVSPDFYKEMQNMKSSSEMAEIFKIEDKVEIVDFYGDYLYKDELAENMLKHKYSIQNIPMLHIAHLGNGVVYWEQGDDEYTAHINQDRQVSLYKEFNEYNKNIIEDFAKSGNMFITNNEENYKKLALEPVNIATHTVYNTINEMPYHVALETINNEQYYCYKQTVYNVDEQSQIAKINYPKEYVFSIYASMFNIENVLNKLEKQGMDVWEGKAFTKNIEKNDSIYFKVQDNKIVACEKESTYVDVDIADTFVKDLPEYFYDGNSLRYNSPGTNRMNKQSDAQILAGGIAIVKIQGLRNFKEAIDALTDKGVTIIPKVKDELTVMLKDKSLTNEEKQKATIYLLVKKGLVVDSEPFIHEKEYDINQYSFDAEQKTFVKSLKEQEKDKNIIINPLNENVMAKKTKEVENNALNDNRAEAKAAARELKDGIQLFPMKSGDYGIREVKNGQASPTIAIKKDAPELKAFFDNVKGQKGDVRNAELKKLAEKYLTPENLQKAQQRGEKEESKYLRLSNAKPEVAARISDVSTYRMSDGKTLAIRCKIDGVQQSGVPMGEKLQNTFLAKAKGTTGDAKKELDVAAAAIAFHKVLQTPEQEQAKGMKR